jgi:hypothetical protein
MSTNPAAMLRPTTLNTVRAVVEQAGIDVSAWETRKNGQLIENPNNNIYRNTQWSFGGTGQPSAVFLWYDDKDWLTNPAQRSDNTKEMQDVWNAMADRSTDGSVKRKLRRKSDQARKLQEMLYQAKAKRLPVRVVFVDGIQARPEESEDTSKVKARELDPVPWYVHELDPYTGKYRLVRNQPPPPPVAVDPYADLVDPGLDPGFQEAIEDLPETEREALIKVRVGQGAFREAVIARWGGCSVTGHPNCDLLIAGHIKPWSKCTTPAERLGAANGLLLTPNLDKLFDRGLITFTDRFHIMLSSKLKQPDLQYLHVDKGLYLKSAKVNKDMLPYLEYHRGNVFKP